VCGYPVLVVPGGIRRVVPVTGGRDMEKYKAMLVDFGRFDKNQDVKRKPFALIWIREKQFIVWRDFYHHSESTRPFQEIPPAHLFYETGVKGEVVKFKLNHGTKAPHWDRLYPELVMVELEPLLKALNRINRSKNLERRLEKRGFESKDHGKVVIDFAFNVEALIKRGVGAYSISQRFEIEGIATTKTYDPKNPTYSKYKRKHGIEKKPQPQKATTSKEAAEQKPKPQEKAVTISPFETSVLSRLRVIRRDQNNQTDQLEEILDAIHSAHQEQPKKQDYKQALVAAYAMLWSAPILLLLYQLWG
jgi:hypothetical protein